MDPSSCTPTRVSVMLKVANVITPFAGGSTMRQITTLGIDTAKQVFQLHGVDVHGNVVLHKRVTRKQVLPLLAQLPPCLVGLEACGGSHYWAREITKLGHTVKLMAPQAVKPYVQGNKTDGRDAEGICEPPAAPGCVQWRSIARQIKICRRCIACGSTVSRCARPWPISS